MVSWSGLLCVAGVSRYCAMQVFEQFLAGDTLEECYAAVASVADRWLDLLDTQVDYPHCGCICFAWGVIRLILQPS